MNPPVKPRNVFLITCSANNKHGERVHLRRTPVLTQNQVDTILAVLIAVRCCLQRLRRGWAKCSRKPISSISGKIWSC